MLRLFPEYLVLVNVMRVRLYTSIPVGEGEEGKNAVIVPISKEMFDRIINHLLVDEPLFRGRVVYYSDFNNVESGTFIDLLADGAIIEKNQERLVNVLLKNAEKVLKLWEKFIRCAERKRGDCYKPSTRILYRVIYVGDKVHIECLYLPQQVAVRFTVFGEETVNKYFKIVKSDNSVRGGESLNENEDN